MRFLVNVPIEKAGANPENKTWKQILFDYETAIKGWNEALAKALDKDDDENFDNHANREHSLRLMRLRDKLAALYTADELKDIIQKYGEERWASRIADFVVRERSKKPLETTTELVDVIKAAIPAKARRDGPHPAKRTFQAIRIEVNDELGRLGRALED